jgi:hypothetical protein
VAQIFRIQDPAPAMGDAEADWLVKNFNYEWAVQENEDDIDPVTTVGCVRISRDDLSRYKYMNQDWEKDALAKHMVECLTLMLNATPAKWVDLLVWW